MKPRRRSSQVMMAYCGTFVLAGGFVTLLASFGAGGVAQTGAATIENRLPVAVVADAKPADDKPADVKLADAKPVEAKPVEAKPTEAMAIEAKLADAKPAEAKPADTPVALTATIPDVARTDVSAASVTSAPSDAAAAAAEPKPIALAALPDASQILPPDTLGVEVSTAPDSAPEEIKPAVALIVPPDDCLLSDVCVDQYLWAFYERTPKQDTNKVHWRKKVTVKRKGKTKTITKRFVTLVDADFTWKDPHAAQRFGMPMINYVIGGMDKSFKRRLLVMLVAAEAEGLLPGITSGFRDDYRQAIASGQKAASNMSYHGGSFRGGYGHGVAADLVSVRGKGRSGRWVHSSILWTWIDERGKDFGIGRPYLNRDPPHVAPIDGREYAAHYRAPKPSKAQVADASKKKVQVADANKKK